MTEPPGRVPTLLCLLAEIFLPMVACIRFVCFRQVRVALESAADLKLLQTNMDWVPEGQRERVERNVKAGNAWLKKKRSESANEKAMNRRASQSK